MSTHPSYPDWPEYRHILAERFGLVMRREPDESWWTWRGHRIHIDTHRPQIPERGTLILVHGAGGHGRLLAPLGQVASDLGWKVLAPDLPAYGITQIRPGWIPDYADWPACLADLVAEQDGPVVLMGLSLGGMTALRAAQGSPKVAGVMATTLIDMGDADTFMAAARWPWLGRLALWSMRHLPWLTDRLSLPLALVTPLDRMTTEPSLQAWFKRSALIGRRWVGIRFFRSLHQYRPPADNLALACPLWLVQPGADLWTPLALSQAVFDQVRGSDKRLYLLDNGSHMPVEAPAWMQLCERLDEFLVASTSGQRAGEAFRGSRPMSAAVFLGNATKRSRV